ncbi:hypothetical protein Dsin_018733 [Dipteronia sinensis]|uniref:RNase H type-1 domain-containing protein n=1 Tax=Dipteronia sinensis TaxID=43782 RepID=A0AAE0E1V3_9ROSI|nr:hypothetical protein Dsin_018733 [Dipteronia sinensis]
MKEFREALDSCGLEDIGFDGPRFTWCNKWDGVGMVEERLDMGGMVSTIRNCVSHLSRWNKRNRQLDKLLEEEEIYWRQRSRVEWLKGNDRNIKFFQVKASVRRVQNCISGLFDENGIWCVDKGDVQGITNRYFGRIFKAGTTDEGILERVLSCVQPRLSQESINLLAAAYVQEEIHQALFDSLLFTKASKSDCLVIRRVLDDYCRASGQLVSFNKSAMCVSRSFSRSDGDRLTVEAFVGWGKKGLDQVCVTVQSSLYYELVPYPELRSCIGYIICCSEIAQRIRISCIGLHGQGCAWAKSIPCSNSMRDDILIWHYTKDGEYTIKSGYHLGMSDQALPSSSDSSYPSSLPEIESDALGVVNLINGKETQLADIEILLCDISKLLCSVLIVSVSFVSRKANMVTHSLAKLGLTASEDKFWPKNFPLDVEKWVLVDMSD